MQKVKEIRKWLTLEMYEEGGKIYYVSNDCRHIFIGNVGEVEVNVTSE